MGGLPLRRTVGEQLELKEELSVADAGVAACRRHRDGMAIGALLDHCFAVFSAHQLKLLWREAQP